jgi:hypothetical protein
LFIFPFCPRPLIQGTPHVRNALFCTFLHRLLVYRGKIFFCTRPFLGQRGRYLFSLSLSLSLSLWLPFPSTVPTMSSAKVAAAHYIQHPFRGIHRADSLPSLPFRSFFRQQLVSVLPDEGSISPLLRRVWAKPSPSRRTYLEVIPCHSLCNAALAPFPI